MAVEMDLEPDTALPNTSTWFLNIKISIYRLMCTHNQFQRFDRERGLPRGSGISLDFERTIQIVKIRRDAVDDAPKLGPNPCVGCYRRPRRTRRYPERR